MVSRKKKLEVKAWRYISPCFYFLNMRWRIEKYNKLLARDFIDHAYSIFGKVDRKYNAHPYNWRIGNSPIYRNAC